MDAEARRGDAAEMLGRIRQQQEQVIQTVLPPAWYWWAVSVLMIGLAIVVDVGGRKAVLAAVSVFVAAVVTLSVPFVFGVGRHARVSRELLGDRGAVAIVIFVWLVVGLTLGVGFTLQWLDARYPATLACVTGATALVIGGPVLMGVLRRIMLDNRAGGAA